MAHSYSTDSAERRYIPFFIAAFAIASTFAIFHVIDDHNLTIPWWASPPIDTMTLYGLFYVLFDRYVWKLQLLHKLHIIKIPDLSGTWRGHVIPVETGGPSAGLRKETAISLTIRQAWTNMIVIGRTAQSKSHSVSGSIVTADEGTLSYEYINEPSASAPATMHAHRGIARLNIKKSGGTVVLDGDYYSGRDRQNIGAIHLTR